MKQTLKTSLFKILKKPNDRGFSIIQILVAIGILGTISVAINSAILSTKSFLYETRGNLQVDDLHAQIVFALSNRHSCFNTFTGLNIPAGQVNFTQIMNGAQAPTVPTPLFVLNTPYNGNVQIISMTADNFAAGGAPLPFTGMFRVTMSYRVRVSTSSTIDKVRRFLVRTETNPANSWVAGSAITKQPEKCMAIPENNSTFGVNPANYLAKTGVDAKSKVITDPIAATADEPQGFVFMMTGGNLTIGGDARIDGGILTMSDLKLKENIRPIEIDKKKLNQLKSYSFTWKDTLKRDIGFVAQDVEKVFPHLVSVDKVSGIKRVNYQEFLPIVLEETRQIEEQNRKLESRILRLETLYLKETNRGNSE